MSNVHNAVHMMGTKGIADRALCGVRTDRFALHAATAVTCMNCRRSMVTTSRASLYRELLAGAKLMVVNAESALHYTIKEQLPMKAEQRLRNIMDWPGMRALIDAIAKLEGQS